jgi:type IV pilus assembly protein PilA
MPRGFTIVELLIVITVIGILASIGIVSYNGSQNNARDAAVRSDLDSAAGVLESYRVTTSTTRSFPATATDLSQVGLQATKASYDQTASTNFVYCAGASDGQSFALVGLSKSGKSFKITQDGLADASYVKNNFADASALCSGLGLSLVASGMSSPGVWQSWVGGS